MYKHTHIASFVVIHYIEVEIWKYMSGKELSITTTTTT